MKVISFNFKFSLVTATMNHTVEADIPLAGEDLVITRIRRESHKTEISSFASDRETADKFLALIEKYDVTSWPGRTPSVLKIPEEGGSVRSCFMTLRFDDGSTGDVTFREVPEETGAEAQKAFTELVFASVADEKKISSRTVYPKLSECREIREKHGPVVAVETRSYSCGMMYNSNQTVYQTIERSGEGRVRVTVRKKAGNEPEASGSAETESDILSRVQEISDRENLPCWEYAAIDPSIPVDRSMQPLDYSSSSSLSVYYDDTLITGMPRVKRTIGESACKLGGAEVDREISDMIYEVVTKSGVKVDMPYINCFANAQPLATQTPPMMQFMGMGMALAAAGTASSEPAPDTSRVSSPAAYNSDGTWNCPSCGETGLTGKFCPGCGRPGPQTETQNRTLGV